MLTVSLGPAEACNSHETLAADLPQNRKQPNLESTEGCVHRQRRAAPTICAAEDRKVSALPR